MDYIKWHFVKVPKRLLKITDNFLEFFTHFFSIPLLLQTFFTPWHRVVEIKKERGLHIGKSIERLIGNIFSSFIGVLLRSLVFIIWLLLVLETALFGLLAVLLWLMLPLVTLPLYFEYKNKSSQPPAPLTDGPVHFWSRERLLSIPSPTANWHFGYTPNLDKYSKDLTEKVYIVEGKIIGRDKELDEITRILSRKTQPALILYGPAGSGRHAVILELARRTKTDSPTIPPQIRNFRIVKIDTAKLLSAGITKAINRNLFKRLLLEAEKAGNIILILDQIDKLTLFFDSLAPFIQRGKVKVIGLTTTKKYQLNLQKNELAKKLFETVKVAFLERKFIVKILEDKARKLNKQYKLIFPTETINHIIDIADKSQSVQPDASLDLIEEIALFCANNKTANNSLTITSEEVNQLAEEKLKIPLTALGPREKRKLSNLEDLLHKYIINQETAISELANALRRTRLKLESANRPLASFLFLGPTGVGKTETAKALNKIYFQSSNSQLSTLNSQLIRFDMSNFQTKQDAQRLITEMANKITQQPYAVLLLDEIEKTHPDILNLFLTIIDEGYFNDLDGDRISCRNLFIIGTSNAASEYIRDEIVKNNTRSLYNFYNSLQKMIIEYVLRENIFTPEFINRFDAVVAFAPLGRGELVQIARLKLQQLNERLKKEHGASIEITEGLIGTIIEEGYKPEFGAREINRAIQRLVENPLAKKLLSKTI
jgi:ATP-dependent Clp protease ATP-binding subunit ClpA